MIAYLNKKEARGLRDLSKRESDATLTDPQRELLAALAWWRDMGHTRVTHKQLAAKADWKAKGTRLRNRLSGLRALEMIEYRSGLIALAPAGSAVAPQPDLSVSVVDSIRAALNGSQRKVFNALLDLGLGGPAVFSRNQLAERLGWDVGGLHFRNRLSELVIVRNGRDCCRSLLEFLHADGYPYFDLEAIIAGQHVFGSWSDHFLAWDPEACPNTLFLRFEQLTGDFHGTLDQLAGFL
jgi:hypothetical protein